MWDPFRFQSAQVVNLATRPLPSPLWGLDYSTCLLPIAIVVIRVLLEQPLPGLYCEHKGHGGSPCHPDLDAWNTWVSMPAFNCQSLLYRTGVWATRPLPTHLPRQVVPASPGWGRTFGGVSTQQLLADMEGRRPGLTYINIWYMCTYVLLTLVWFCGACFPFSLSSSVWNHG